MSTPTIIVEDMRTYAEMQQVMDAHCAAIPWEGGSPDLTDTNYLAEEIDEVAEGVRKPKLKK